MNARSAGSPSSSGSELLDVRLAHAGEPVQAVGVVGRDGGQARSRGQPVAAERGAREGMRPTARDAPGREALEPERVGDRLDIGGAVADVAPCVPASSRRSRAGRSRSA